jgi:hypothetical protein
MANHSLRDERQQELRRELRRQRLPAAYIARLLSELDDHYTDLLEERSSSMGSARKLEFQSDDLEQRLGYPTQLAVFAAERYHARSFWGRHPVVTYVLGPLPLLIAMWVVYLASIQIPVYCVGTFGERMGWWTQAGSEVAAQNHLLVQAILLTIFTWGVLVLPPLGAALALCRVYRRNRLDWRWPVLGCAVLALLVAAFQVSWRLDTGPSVAERGLFLAGIIPPISARAVLLFSAKFAAAMAIGLLLVKRAHRQLQLAT